MLAPPPFVGSQVVEKNSENAAAGVTVAGRESKIDRSPPMRAEDSLPIETAMHPHKSECVKCST
jgi:N-acetyl-gamma-glutamylphosphate reductase